MGGSPQTSTLNTVNPEFQQLISGYLSSAAPAITSLTGGAGASYGTDQATTRADAAGLNNFNALTQPQIAELSTQAGQAVESAGKTASATSGGVPNQALQNRNLAVNAGQATGAEATQLGNIAANQKLAATEASANTSAGLSQEDLQGMLGALGLSTEALNTGSSGTLNVANQQGQAYEAKNQGIESGIQGAASLGTAAATGGFSSGGSAGKSGGGVATDAGPYAGLQAGYPTG